LTFLLELSNIIRTFAIYKLSVSPSKSVSYMVVNVFTSNFRKAKALDSSKYLVVSISRINPKGFNGVWLKELAPSSKLLSDYKKGLDWSDYVERYRSECCAPDYIKDFLSSLVFVTKGRDIVLCCYESADKNCHRFIIADYIKSTYGYVVNEL